MRARVWIPPPQVRVHSVHSFQSLHCPSTKREREQVYTHVVRNDCCQGHTQRGRDGGGGFWAVAPARKTKRFFFPNIVFNFAGLSCSYILVRNLYTGDPCEGVRSLPPQTNNQRYGPGCPGEKISRVLSLNVNKLKFDAFNSGIEFCSKGNEHY